MSKSNKIDPKIEAVFARILASAPPQGARQLASWRKPREEIRKLARRDYVRALRRCIGYQELKTLLAAVDRILARAGINEAALLSVDGLRAAAAKLRLHFKATQLDGPDGLALFGFYVGKQAKVLDHPLIYVNTAHVPLAIASAFFHEFGHHVTAELIESEQHQVHFFFDAAYSLHLDDPVELAADAIVSLRGYPRPVAVAMFGSQRNSGLVARAGSLEGSVFGQVRDHLKGAGFDFSPDLPVNQNLQYLSGMIHYAKLRWALLAEYDL